MQPSAQTAHAQTAPTGQPAAPLESADPPAISTYELENGMDVVLAPIPGSSAVSLGIVFKGGADAQTKKTAGLFRLLEHVIFRGVAASPGADEPAGAIDALDALATDGGTKADRFSLSYLIAPSMLEQGLDTVSYLFSSLRLDTAFSDSEALEMAKKASLDDIENEEDDAEAVFESAMAKKLFASAPWRLDVPGAESVVNSATEDTLRAFAAAWLIPNNAALVLAGDFDPAAARPMIEKAFSSWKKGANPWKMPLPVFPKPGVARPTLMVYPDPAIQTGEAVFEIRYRGPDAGSNRAAAARLWAEMASQPGSRLPSAIAKALPKWSTPSDIDARYAMSADASWFSVSARVKLDPKAGAADAALSFKEAVRGSEMYAVKTNPGYFGSKEYDRAKDAVADVAGAALADPWKAGAIIADGWILGGARWTDAWLDRVRKTASKDVAAFADEYCMKNLEIVSVRLNPKDYAARKKSFDSYGFEVITPQKAFWWE